MVFPVNKRKPKIKIEPKNILPNASTFGFNSFRKCLLKMFSTLQNKTAIKIIKSAELKEVIFKPNNRKTEKISKIEPIKAFELIFSFRKITAKTETNKNIVLWIKAELKEEVSFNALKNKTKGMLPPINPTETNLSQFFWERVLR